MTGLEKLTAWFRAQIGTSESGENEVVYNEDYYGAPVQGAQYPWCCAFIWDGFHQTGLSALFCGGAKTAYCPFVVEWARAQNAWVTGQYRKGDLLLYDWNHDGVADHIGFCTYAADEYAYAIEGNVNDTVAEVTRWMPDILGAYRPEYGAEDIPDTGAGDKENLTTAAALPLVKRGDVSGAVLSVQTLLIHKWAISCGPDGADGDFGPNTENAVKAFQTHNGLNVDGIVGPVTWGALIGG